MTTRRARRVVRSAGLVAVAAAAAFSLSACQGDGQDAAGPAKKDTVSASSTSGGGALGGSKASTEGAQTSADKRISVRPESSAAHRTTASSAPAQAAAPIHTQPLADGSTAKIYKVGSQRYLAKLVSHGAVFATLETGEHDAGLDANDMFVTLTLDGQVHSWMGGGHQGPGTFKLAGGWTAKVAKLGDTSYRAQIIGHDGVAATVAANQHDAGLDANGVYIVLSAGGVISANM